MVPFIECKVNHCLPNNCSTIKNVDHFERTKNNQSFSAMILFFSVIKLYIKPKEKLRVFFIQDNTMNELVDIVGSECQVRWHPQYQFKFVCPGYDLTKPYENTLMMHIKGANDRSGCIGFAMRFCY